MKTEEIARLSEDELKELLFLTMYKLSVTRAQLDALMEILTDQGVIDSETLWKKIGERLQD